MTDARPAASPHRTVHMVGNSHLDLVWLWPWQEAYQEARATFASVLDRMDEYDDFVFTCDQVVLLAWVEEQDPALFDRIRARVAEGRWVNTGGWWVEPDCNIPSGESLARQGLHGQRFLASRFGRPATAGMNADPFGHAGTIPQILRGQRMDSYSFLRPMAHEMALPPSPFRWTAPDGSAVAAYRIPFEYQTAWTSVDRHVEKAIAELPPGDDDVMVFFGVGDHGGGPTKAEIDTVHRFDAMGSFGALRLSSPPAYFAEVLGQDGLDPLPEVRGDLQHHSPGCYSAHSQVKILMRRAESAVLVAERWAAIAGLTGGPAAPREQLAHAWRQVLLNQFHDVLPGTAIEAGYDDARDQLGEATAIAKRVTARAQNVLASRIAIPLDAATQPVVVFNPHPWPVRADVELHLGVGHDVDPDRVTDEAGERVLSQPVASRTQVGRSVGAALAFSAELPPLGHRTWTLHRSRSRSGGGGGILRGPTHLENDLLRVELDPASGDLAVLLDKRSGIDLLDGARGPHVQVSADSSDTWGHRVVSYAGPGEPMRLDRIRVREDGALRAVLRVERSLRGSRLVEEFVLGRDADRVAVRVELDWQERAHLLKLRWPLALTDCAAETEIPYGSTPRPVDGGEEPGRSWVDMTGTTADGRRAGLSLVNDAKHGYDFSPASAGRSPSIGITAVRSPVFAWHDPTPLEDDGVYSHQDIGAQRWTVLLVPHDGDPDRPALHRAAAELGIRPRAMLEGFHDGPAASTASTASFVSVDHPSVLVTAVKTAEDGEPDLVVRVLETSGEAVQAVIEAPVVGRSLQIELPPHALRTWRIPTDPAAPAVPVDLIEWPLDDAAPWEERP